MSDQRQRYGRIARKGTLEFAPGCPETKGGMHGEIKHNGRCEYCSMDLLVDYALDLPAWRDALRPRSAAEQAEDVKCLYEMLKKIWSTFEGIERAARECREALPAEHELRIKLLAIETMASMQLAKPRKARAVLAAELARGSDECRATGNGASDE